MQRMAAEMDAPGRFHIAMRMILTGDRLKADAAESFGLVNQVVRYADLTVTARRWAEKVNTPSPLANARPRRPRSAGAAIR